MPGEYLGHNWGDLAPASAKQKGITTYLLSPNRQKPFAGAAHNAVFNTWRRFKGSVLYWAPPFVLLYFALDWANKRNHFLHTKKGREMYGDSS